MRKVNSRELKLSTQQGIILQGESYLLESALRQMLTCRGGSTVLKNGTYSLELGNIRLIDLFDED